MEYRLKSLTGKITIMVPKLCWDGYSLGGGHCSVPNGGGHCSVRSVHCVNIAHTLKTRYNGSLHSQIFYIANRFVCTKMVYAGQKCFDIANIPI